jgi:hypothetical protein
MYHVLVPPDPVLRYRVRSSMFVTIVNWDEDAIHRSLPPFVCWKNDLEKDMLYAGRNASH